MSTVFRFCPGETEKQLKFGSDSEAVVVASDAKMCAGNRPAGVQRVRQFPRAGVWNRSKRIRDSPVSVECAVLCAERDPLGTADATADPELANFAAAQKFPAE